MAVCKLGVGRVVVDPPKAEGLVDDSGAGRVLLGIVVPAAGVLSEADEAGLRRVFELVGVARVFEGVAFHDIR